MYSLLSFIIVLGVLIFVHELGHFLFAKLFGVRVLRFSLGFGTPVLTKKWGETEYLLSAIPLGGYVKMYGESPDVPVDENEKHCSFSHKPVWQRFFVVLAGPLFNIVFAIVVFFSIFFIVGLPELADSTAIGQVQAGSPAEQAGLQVGDVIRAINGKETTRWMQVAEFIKESQGSPVELDLSRQGEPVQITVTPTLVQEKNIFQEDIGERYMLGIVSDNTLRYVEATFWEAGRAACIQSYNLSYLTILYLWKMVQQVIPASELGGPIRIAEAAGESLKRGWLYLFNFMGQLSVNLAVLNLLPVPVLDGGHLVFLTFEGIRGKPLGDRIMGMSLRIGIALLATLMLFVFYNDIARLVRLWMAP
ncbi:MAG: RIP metalloprotease RseP [Desulfobulbus propionicus]|nr:MAG: RIP metalloprotease RseP [Desulfobulbus propionicus]